MSFQTGHTPEVLTNGRFAKSALITPSKVHKVQRSSSDMTLLKLSPVISNIGTATYNLTKYLAELLSPLTKSEYTVINTNDFISEKKTSALSTKWYLLMFRVYSPMYH